MHFLQPGFGVVDLKGFEKLRDLNRSVKQVPTDLKALEQLLSWFDQLNQPSIPTEIWIQCQLALAEGFTNAVRHAHKGLPTNIPIDIEVTLFPQYLEIRIWDQGAPFDLEQGIQNQNQKMNEHPPGEYPPGGRGLVLMRTIADKLSYTRTNDNRNCLLIVKSYERLDRAKQVTSGG